MFGYVHSPCLVSVASDTQMWLQYSVVLKEYTQVGYKSSNTSFIQYNGTRGLTASVYEVLEGISMGCRPIVSSFMSIYFSLFMYVYSTNTSVFIKPQTNGGKSQSYWSKSGSVAPQG